MRNLLLVLASVLLSTPVFAQGTYPAPTFSGGNVGAATVTATGGTTARTLADRASDLINVKDKGAKGDGQLQSPTVTLTGTSLTVGSSLFAATDVGKTILVAFAGPANTSGGQGTVPGTIFTVPVLTPGNGYASIPTCAISDATGTGATCSTLMAIQSATLTTGGAGCLNGTQKFIVGIDATGTPAKFTGVVSGGVLTGTLTVTTPGIQSAMGAVTSVPAYGGNCSTPPTVSLSYGVGGVQITNVGASYSTSASAALSGGSPSVAATVGAPRVGQPNLPLETTISAYVSPTQVTLAAPATVNISGVTTQIFWATDDTAAFQNALAQNKGLWIPRGYYWINGILNPTPSKGDVTIRGEGMEASVLLWDNGTSIVENSGSWQPLFKNTIGSYSNQQTGNVQFEDFQIRGLVDFGRVNIGAAANNLVHFNSVTYQRMKFYQMPWTTLEDENVVRFTVDSSIFDTAMRDQARCRGCQYVKIRGSTFAHSDDDSVSDHQVPQNSPVMEESLIVEGNDFTDTTGVHVLGARNAVIVGNTFRRMKLYSVNLSWGTGEGSNQLGSLIISNNTSHDQITRVPFGAAGCVYCISVVGANAPTGITSFAPGSTVLNIATGVAFSAKPWDWNTPFTDDPVDGSSYAPAARGVIIHDNIYTRTLPAAANYSAWGFGLMMSASGYIDPPVPDTGLVPSTGIQSSVNIPGLKIHNNDIQDVAQGISIIDTVTAPEEAFISIKDNNLYNTYQYGILASGSGTLAGLDITGNNIDVDPYLLSPGRRDINGAWTNGYTSSQCLLVNYSATAQFSYNRLSNCNQVTVSPVWSISHNIIRGAPFTGTTGQLVYSTVNRGIGVYPNNMGEQWIVSPIAANAAQPFTTYGAINFPHPLSAASLPTTGYHVIGDKIWSSNPGACSCEGWIALTSGQTWVEGVDFVAIQQTMTPATVVPTTGQTVTVANGTGTYIVTPAGTLAALTITLPASGYSIGSTLTITFNQAITALTVNGNTGQTVNGAAPGSATLGQTINYRWVAANTWQRVQ